MIDAIADTGPRVAFLDRAERNKAWAVERVRDPAAAMLVCAPGLAEAMHLLSRLPKAQDVLLGLVEQGALQVAFHVAEHIPELRALRRKYADRPMSLADACIVRMAELFERHRIFTLDSDFSVYRKHGREALEMIVPIRG